MAEGSYWSSEFSCPTIAEFLDESVCENTEDVAGDGELPELVLNGRIPLEPWTINSKAMLPHPLLRPHMMLTWSQQCPRVATRLKDIYRNWARTMVAKERCITVATTD